MPFDPTPEEAAAIAVHKVTSAAQATEMTRQVQVQQAIEDTAVRTKQSMMEVLKDIFGDSDSKDPEQMKILVRRIPLLCTRIDQMHNDISSIQSNLSWGIRLVLGAVILAVVYVVIKR